MNENMNEIIETTVENNEVIDQTVDAAKNSPLNFGTGLALGAAGVALGYGAFKLGRKLVKKFKDKRAEDKKKNTTSVEVDGQVIEGEIVDEK